VLATSSSTGTPPKSIRISSTNRSTTAIAAPGKESPRPASGSVITGYGLTVDIPLEPLLASPKQAALSHG
jgi:hypothetical protein